VAVSNEDLHQFVVFTKADTFMTTTRDIMAYWLYHDKFTEKQKNNVYSMAMLAVL